MQVSRQSVTGSDRWSKFDRLLAERCRHVCACRLVSIFTDRSVVQSIKLQREQRTTDSEAVLWSTRYFKWDFWTLLSFECYTVCVGLWKTPKMMKKWSKGKETEILCVFKKKSTTPTFLISYSNATNFISFISWSHKKNLGQSFTSLFLDVWFLFETSTLESEWLQIYMLIWTRFIPILITRNFFFFFLKQQQQKNLVSHIYFKCTVSENSLIMAPGRFILSPDGLRK